MDIRSFHLNFEVNAVLFDEKGIQDLTMHYKHDLKQATKIDFENFIKRPKRQKVAEAFARLASPLL
jgi:cardiolipin synthase